MGCNTSKLDDEETVQICKDRKKFIKEALEYRTKFALGHFAYIQSLKKVSAALREYIEGDEPREFSLDSFMTPPLKKSNPKFINGSPNCFSTPPPIESRERSSVRINYYRPSGTAPVSVEERPHSPETFRIESYSPPMQQQYGFDGFFSMQSTGMNAPDYSSNPYNRPAMPPPSPQNSQWDFFWNPFSSLDYYGYPVRSSLEQTVVDDDPVGLRQVREEEGIPDLEEETEYEEIDAGTNQRQDRTEADLHATTNEEVTVEDVDEDEDDDDDEEETECECEDDHVPNELKPPDKEDIEMFQVQNNGQVELNRHATTVTEREKKEESTPGFTVYVNRRPTSMDEVIKDLEAQFVTICNASSEVSATLEANRAQCLPPSNELSASKVFNPVALFRSASSRSSSSRFVVSASGGSRDGEESSSDFSDESSGFSGSHHSTLDQLLTWENRLYKEVRAAERVRLAYAKKSAQLRSQEMKGEEPSTLEKTRAALRNLDTQMKVSINSIEAIAKRIEALRDDELQHQLWGLVKGLARMWKVMAECHQIQKHTLDEAKLLLAGTPSKSKRHSGYIPSTQPHRLAQSAANLESEVRNWRSCFESWITSQRSYVHAVSCWLLRCMRCEPNASKLPFSPRRSAGVHPIFGMCIQWTRFLDGLKEDQVLDGLDFFSAGMGSMYAQQQLQQDDSNRAQSQLSGSRRFESPEEGDMQVVEMGQGEEDGMTPEKTAEVAVRVLCAGMSVAMSTLTDFATSSAEGYAQLLNQWENAKGPPSSNAQGM